MESDSRELKEPLGGEVFLKTVTEYLGFIKTLLAFLLELQKKFANLLIRSERLPQRRLNLSFVSLNKILPLGTYKQVYCLSHFVQPTDILFFHNMESFYTSLLRWYCRMVLY